MTEVFLATDLLKYMACKLIAFVLEEVYLLELRILVAEAVCEQVS